MSTFDYNGYTLERFDHLYNSTAISERGLEIAVADHWIDTYGGGLVLEVGNVLSHYDKRMPGPVVDKYEQGQGVTNMDLFDVVGPYSLIVSISTLEHVGMDYGEDHDDQGTHKAVEHLKTCLLDDESRLCVTIPIGWRPGLNPDDFGFQTSAYYCRMFTHPGWWSSEWGLAGREFSDLPEWARKYGTETPWANTVWVGEYQKS